MLILYLGLLALPAMAATTYKIESDFITFKKKLEKLLLESGYQLKTTKKNELSLYFDTPGLSILENNGYLYYHAHEYLSKKNKKKYRETIKYSNNGSVISDFMVKHYKSVKSIQEKHPLIALVKRKQRPLFMKTLRATGIKYPMKLNYIFDVFGCNHQKKHRFS